MHLFELPKIDRGGHVLDPARFPDAPDALSKPQGQEAGSADAWTPVMPACGVRHAGSMGTEIKSVQERITTVRDFRCSSAKAYPAPLWPRSCARLSGPLTHASACAPL